MGDEAKEVRYRLNPIENIPGIVRDCLDGYATIDQAIYAIRRILTEAVQGMGRIIKEGR